MENKLAIKVYEVDYQFIVDNYTNPKLWEKTWTIFAFKNYVFTIELDSINVKKKQIYFNLKLNSDLDVYHRNKEEQIMHDLQNSNLTVLLKQINGSMLRLVTFLEQELIRETSSYELAVESHSTERERLTEIAEEFLDEQSVYNSEIREAYIGYFVDKNETLYNAPSRCMEIQRYQHLTDLFLMLCAVHKDEETEQAIIRNQDRDISHLQEEIEEHVAYMETETYEEEMKNSLEGI